MSPTKNISEIKAFTLIELSIVLVIISLIVGGVIGGKSLIRSAEIQNAISQIGEIRTAVNNFTLQYDALAGDMRDATSYWPGVTSNGNGNGHFDEAVDDDYIRNEEGGYFWHHMGLAQVFRPYARPDTTNFSYEYGAHSPQIFKKTVALGQYRAGQSIDRYQVGKNILVLAQWTNPAASLEATCASVDMKAAISIDKKLDDGIASTGGVLAFSGSICETDEETCTDYTAEWDYEQTAGTVDYDKSRPDGICRMAFTIFGN